MDIDVNNVYQGDCLKLMKQLPGNSIDAVVTDPPYGLKFMGKKWDYDVPSADIWGEVMRILKPGAHLLSFGGPRTYHRLVEKIESVKFEIRDQLMWVYASGFPKSLDIGKTLKKWKGWGTGLKPEHEPIVLARKPLSEKTVAANVKKWGTGALNIDGCRLDSHAAPRLVKRGKVKNGGFLQTLGDTYYKGDKGRYPGNFLLDEEAAKNMDEHNPCRPSKYFYVAKPTTKERGAFNRHPTVKPIKIFEYLIRLVMPPGGVMVDPFGGSGTSALACIELGIDWILFEREAEHVDISRRRIKQHLFGKSMRDKAGDS